MKKLKIVLLLSLFLNVILMGVGGIIVEKKGGFHYITTQVSAMTSQGFPAYYNQRLSIFKALPTKDIDAIFLGDSITEHSEWNELFNNFRILNRGISNDDTAGVINRIHEVTDRKPKSLFIMIGINDLLKGNSASYITKNYKKIIDIVKEDSPTTKIYVQSVLPVNNKIYGSKINNNDVISLDNNLKALAKEEGVTYVDLYSVLSENNQLIKDYTFDGLHLKGNAYSVWKEQIQKYIN